ncbi:hypothetical protein [Spirosoma oryzicola]|uniref:hypothetical protein n=1 Tax=Spirosoma oryzicola TaxID=2898794 RepID=UPI001E5E62DF|nr:hypothetical protein [Spirosoma oryzicola]UHG91105.1 hypothetical protein LQ777_23070 [Spirosoma oryzicola]
MKYLIEVIAVVLLIAIPPLAYSLSDVALWLMQEQMQYIPIFVFPLYCFTMLCVTTIWVNRCNQHQNLAK